MAEQGETGVRKLAAVPSATGLATRLAVAELEQRSTDAGPLFARSGISAAALAHGGRVDVRAQIEFLELASHAVGDEFLGLTLADGFDLRELGMLYYVATSSHCVRDALRRLQRYIGVGNEALVVRISIGSICRIGLAYAGVPRHLDRHQMEFFALAFVRLCRQLAGQKISPLGASFVHHRSGELHRAFDLLGCDVRFNSEADEISFEAALLDRQVVTDDPFLNRLMVDTCEHAMAARTSNVSPLRTTVENIIAPLLPHAEASTTKVAKALGLSERTFARRLASEGLRFGTILDELRRDLAIRYLEEPGLQISQIAWLLGFHQPSAFSHAARRWTGKSPSQYRRHLSTQDKERQD